MGETSLPLLHGMCTPIRPLPCWGFGALEQAHKIQHLEGGDGLFVPKSWHPRPKSSSVIVTYFPSCSKFPTHSHLHLYWVSVRHYHLHFADGTASRWRRTEFCSCRAGGKFRSQQSCDTVLFVGVNWRFSVYLAAVIIGVWGGLSNPKCLILSCLEIMQPPKSQKNPAVVPQTALGYGGI